MHASLGKRQASLDATIQGVVKARVIRRDSLTSQEDVAVVQSAYEAFRLGDIQAIFALLHLEIELDESEWVPWRGEYKGH